MTNFEKGFMNVLNSETLGEMATFCTFVFACFCITSIVYLLLHRKDRS